MRVLLPNPSSTNTYQSVGVTLPPPRLLYIAAAVRHRGYDVQIVDQSVDNRTIDYTLFDMLGIHSDTTRFYKAMNVARQAKAAGAKVVMWGPHPCFSTMEVLGSGVVDAIVACASIYIFLLQTPKINAQFLPIFIQPTQAFAQCLAIKDISKTLIDNQAPGHVIYSSPIAGRNLFGYLNFTVFCIRSGIYRKIMNSLS